MHILGLLLMVWTAFITSLSLWLTYSSWQNSPFSGVVGGFAAFWFILVSVALTVAVWEAANEEQEREDAC